MATQAERIAVLENEYTHVKEELSVIKSDVENIDDFLRNGFTDKIKETVREEIARCIPKQKATNGKKNIVSKVWQNENFWKLLNRGMVITLFMVFIIICALLGIDISGQDSIIRKLIGLP